jgi:GDP-L-fucose synthase
MGETRPALPDRYDLSAKRVWVAGHRGMVGGAIVRRLASESCEIITADRSTVDLTRQEVVGRWLEVVRPQAIFLAAAKVGGILANSSCPATFLYDNLMIETNTMHAARRMGVEKLVFLGSSCIYPKHAPQPILQGRSLEAALSRPTKRMQ